MGNLNGLVSIVSELRTERTNLVNQLKYVDEALTVLGRLDGGKPYVVPKRALSASARRRISLAQKARWAKARNGSASSSSSAPKRILSAAARRKIAAAQRARWAKWKAAKKAA